MYVNYLQEKEYEVLEKLGKLLMDEHKDDANDVFGKMIATEIKSVCLLI